MRKKNVKFWIFIAFTALLLTSCASEETIRIGVIGTMSGIGSDLSVSGRRGIELAVSQINQNGGIDGKMIEIVLKDDLNSVEEALKSNREFTEDNVQLIIGHFTSEMVMGVIDYINNEEVLMLGPTISADSLSMKDDNFIRFIDSTLAEAEVLIDVIQRSTKKKVMAVYDQNNSGFVSGFMYNFEFLLKYNAGIDTKIIAYNPNDFESVDDAVREIILYSPDSLLIVSSAEESAGLARQIKQEVENVQLYGSLWANTPELIRKGGTAVDGMVLVGGVDLEDESPEFLNFKKIYFDRFGEQPTFASIYGYETMMALSQAIEKSKSIEPKLVKASLLKISKYHGIQDDYEIDEYGDNTRNYTAYKIKSGNYRKVD